MLIKAEKGKTLLNYLNRIQSGREGKIRLWVLKYTNQPGGCVDRGFTPLNEIQRVTIKIGGFLGVSVYTQDQVLNLNL